MKTTLIYGPPGTGKTHTLKERISGAKAGRSLCLSHTRAAARELAQRIPGAEASTIHSLAYRCLGLQPYEVVTNKLLTGFSDRTGIDFADSRGEDALTAGDEYRSLLSYARNSFQEPGAVADRVHLGTTAQFDLFCDAYVKWKRENYLLDFDDMLHRVAPDMLKDDWVFLVVDEAQDLTPIQWRIIQTLILQNNFQQVWIAGDDDQAIYTWAGADPEGLRRFGSSWNAETEILSQSYRVPYSVHRIAEKILARIKRREPKKYRPRAFLGECSVVTQIDHARYYDVILYRNHSIGRQLANDLCLLGIPFLSRGIPSPIGSWWGQLVIAYLHLLGGEALTSKKIQAIEKASRKNAGVLAQQQRSWRLVFPALPPKIRADLALIEARFGPLQKVKPITLTSIHQYKGKEANAVLVIDGMNERTREGFAKNPDDEYRVFYVAVTRAREKLGILEHDNPLGIGRL